MVELLTIFLTGYLSVFALGFQSRNVNNGNYGYAAASSFVIGLSSVYLWNHVPANMIGSMVYGASGAAGITSAMYVHQKFIKKAKNDKT